MPAVEDHGAHILTARRLLGQFLQPVLHGDVQRVHRRAVQTDRPDTLGHFEMHSHGSRLVGVNDNGPGVLGHSTPGPLGHQGNQQTYAIHFSQGMFHALSPLSGSTTRSWEFFTITTSPTIE